MSKIIFLSLISTLAFVSAALVTESVYAQKSMLCKLQSDKVIQGRERQCLYRCSDGSLEGRTRRVNQECLKTVYSAT